MNKSAFGFVVLTIALSACSSNSDSDPGQGATLQAPVITEVMPMLGALHIIWENKQADCDAIEGERTSPSKPYEMIFSVPGSVDNKMDPMATELISYTYRLRCKKSNAYSQYSNESSATPRPDAG